MHSLKHGLLAAVAAAALVAGAGSAMAQADKKMESETGAKAQTQTQKNPTTPQGGARIDSKTEAQKPADSKAQSGASAQKDDGKSSVTTQKDAQTPAGGARMDSKTEAQKKSDDMRPRGQVDKKDGKSQTTTQKDPQTPSGGSRMDSKTEASGKTDAKASVQLNDEQRTRISTSIKQKNVNVHRVQRNDIHFQINVGVAVPRTVTLYPLPAPIVAVVPAYRGYLYIVVGDDLLIIHPTTHEIVAIIPA